MKLAVGIRILFSVQWECVERYKTAICVLVKLADLVGENDFCSFVVAGVHVDLNV